MVRSALHGLLTTPTVSGGHERALAPLLVLLLAETVGGTFAGLLVLLRLAFKAVENSPNCLLTRGISGGDVEELLSGSWALTSQLMNQGLVGSPR